MTVTVGEVQGVREGDAGGGVGARGHGGAHRGPDDSDGPLRQRDHRAVEGGPQRDLAGPTRAHRDQDTGMYIHSLHAQ